MTANPEWDRLAGAAMDARDELRALAGDLIAAMNSGRIPRVLIIRARDVAARHADSLRIALKHPSLEPPRRKYSRDLPCWSDVGRDGRG